MYTLEQTQVAGWVQVRPVAESGYTVSLMPYLSATLGTLSIKTDAETDTTPPTVTFTASENQTEGYAGISGRAFDENSGVNRVRVLIRDRSDNTFWDGTNWSSTWTWHLANLSGSNWWLDDVPVDPGVYDVFIWAWDNAGNRANQSENPQPLLTVSGTADTTAPTTTFDTPTSLPAGITTLTGTATDDDSGVNRVRVLVRDKANNTFWDGTTWNTTWSWNLATLNGTTWTLPGVNLQPGTFDVFLWAWDNEDNLARPASNPQPLLTVS